MLRRRDRFFLSLISGVSLAPFLTMFPDDDQTLVIAAAASLLTIGGLLKNKHLRLTRKQISVLADIQENHIRVIQEANYEESTGYPDY